MATDYLSLNFPFLSFPLGVMGDREVREDAFLQLDTAMLEWQGNGISEGWAGAWPQMSRALQLVDVLRADFSPASQGTPCCEDWCRTHWGQRGFEQPREQPLESVERVRHRADFCYNYYQIQVCQIVIRPPLEYGILSSRP